MSLKRWMLGKVNETPDRRATGAPRLAPSLHGALPADDEPTLGRSERRGASAHLGPYAPLVGAIRAALEDFAASGLKLHLAIAERDRYVLTSVEVTCEGSDEEHALLKRFVAEFTPEQIKRYLARDVIAALRNASAIDLSQFAGLTAIQDGRAAARDEDPYADLIADLRGDPAAASASPYEVELVGRWSSGDAPAGDAHKPVPRARDARDADAVHTPLSGRTLTLDIEDAEGARRVEIEGILPGRRYVVGKDGGCDIVIHGTFASRRHCEVWLEDGAWHAADAGSTNGIRVEAGGGVTRRAPESSDRTRPLALPDGAWLVLSAHASGTAERYPRLCVRAGAARVPDAVAATSIATPIAPPRPRGGGLTVAAHMSSGVREAELAPHALPFDVGRSRNQALVIDGGHGEVSGRHLSIVALDDAGASVVVHGDNGVSVEGTTYPAGTQFRWKAGETLRLGRPGGEGACTLTLARSDS